MANSFEIKNFKGFNNSMRLELSPITLIFGINSAGKSSIIDSLRLIQNSQYPTLDTYNENNFDLGDPIDVITNNESKISYSFEFLRNPKSSRLDDSHCMFNPNIESKESLKIINEYKYRSNIDVPDIFIDKIKVISDYNKIAEINFNENVSFGISNQNKSQLLNFKGKINYLSNETSLWIKFINNLFFNKNYNSLINFLTNIISQKKIDTNNTSSEIFKNISIERLEIFLSRMRKWKLRSDVNIKTIVHFVLSNKVDIDLEKIKNLDLSKEDIKKIAKASADLNDYKLEIKTLDLIVPEDVINFFIKDIVENYEISIGQSYDGSFFDGKKSYSQGSDTTFIENINKIYDSQAPSVLFLIDFFNSSCDKYFNNFYFLPCHKTYERSYQKRRGRDRGYLKFNSTRSLIEDFTNNPKLLEEVNNWFEQSSINSKFEILEKEDSKSLLVNDLTKKNVKKINIVDSGSGLRQILPIIAATFLNESQDLNKDPQINKFKTLALEEPEANLHPKLQIDLANFITQTVTNLSKTSYIIETHSEHMMLTFQKLIRDGLLPADYLNVYCVTKDNDGHYTHKMELDKNGNFLSDWPQGFFDERLELI